MKQLTAHQQYRKDANERRKAVLRLHRKGEKQVGIAKAVGLTRERVRQIINAAKEAN